MTLPPSPRWVAEASIVVVWSMATLVAVATVFLPPMSTLPPPASPDASSFAPVIEMFSPVTLIVPPFCPAFLPAAEIVPASFTFCAGAPAGLLLPVAAASTMVPPRCATAFASITPLLLMTESTTYFAAAAVIYTLPPLADSVPLFATSEVSG
jgi:hypothetical protein